MTETQSRKRHLVRSALILLGLLVLVLLAATTSLGLWLRGRARANLPILDGELTVAGLTAPVVVERDDLGVPRLRGAHRVDVAFATGFVHAQDRFFQMDLLRRRSSGEMSELLGAAAMESDRKVRVHRLRERARQALTEATPEVRSLLEAYTRGVNAGLAAQEGPPFEYAVLRVEARPWAPEDTFSVLLSMFLQLGDVEGEYEAFVTEMHEYLPPEMVEFLLPMGTEWDAALLGEAFSAPPVPAPQVFSLRETLPKAAHLPVGPSLLAGEGAPTKEAMHSRRAASNSWAVAADRSAAGGPLLVNDIHLAEAVPNLWYRASFEWADEMGEPHRVTGVTLPGAPAMVAGSNGWVAWGVTNSMADTTDLVLLETEPAGRYQTPHGPRPFQHFTEVLRGGGEEETLEVDWTVWGPVVGKDTAGRRRVAHSIVHEPAAVDLEILQLEVVRDVEQAVDAAQRSGVPALSFVAADWEGRIAWTVMGRLPRRIGFDGSVSASWADGSRRWEGLLPPAQVPALVDPEAGLLWSANQRLADGEALKILGTGNFLVGARAGQIRDRLMALDMATMEDMRRLLLDDRALFLERWQQLLLELLTPEALAGQARRAELRRAVEDWGGRAMVESAGFRMVRTFRYFLARRVFGALTTRCREVDPEFDYTFTFNRFEGPLWQLVTEQPPHLLASDYETWEDLMLDVVDEVLGFFPGPLAEQTWGDVNTLAMRHPFSRAMPLVGRWLDMPPDQLPGSHHMPRVQDPDYGSTFRFAVIPGKEEDGFFHMPGGQSGNPASPHYRDGHNAWVEGEATPFLPGPSIHSLILRPDSDHAGAPKQSGAGQAKNTPSGAG